MPSSTSVPYFPPPPRAASLPPHKHRPSPPSASAKRGILKSSRTSKPKAASILHQSRTFLLPLLLVATFVIVILSVIFGYCVASHGTSDASDTGNTASSTTSSSSDDSSGPANAALIFYLLTCPVALMCLLSVELVLHHHYYYLHRGNNGSTTYASTSTSTSSRFFSTPSLFNPHARLPSFCFLFIHIIILLAFVISASFWTACEVPPPASTALDKVCPVQVRGHFMYGIHELSIAKAVMAWVVAVGLVLHIWCQVKTRRSARGSRRTRWVVDGAHADYTSAGGKTADVEVLSVDDSDTSSAASTDKKQTANKLGGIFATVFSSRAARAVGS